MLTDKDPVCGMIVRGDRFTTTIGDRTVYFCSAYCRRLFQENPEKYPSRAAQDDSAAEPTDREVAYFSMEVAVRPEIHTYSGGLGVLAGDTLKSAADLKVPIVGVTLLSRKGYIRQTLDRHGGQVEDESPWDPDEFLQPLEPVVEVAVAGRRVAVRAWQHNIVGTTGFTVPLLFLDTGVNSNGDFDRSLTDHLYGGDPSYRLAQEIVLGVGGVRMLRALGFTGLHKYHMNEGHASLLVLELLREANPGGSMDWPFEEVRSKCVFTTHTPVESGHDRFGYDLAEGVLGNLVPQEVLRMLAGPNELNMTWLGFNLSRYLNGVAKRHEEVSRRMFPGYPIQHITNGVHSGTWVCPAFKELFDRRIPGWSADPAMLRKAVGLPAEEIWNTHMKAKSRLLGLVAERLGVAMSPDVLTIGFARRATAYKRADLIFSDPSRLVRIARQGGPLQLVFAGKAHPRDEVGKDLIRRIVGFARRLEDQIPVVYLEDYDMALAGPLVAGVDLWLNTPQPPLEASGTSGMKAAHNGVPSLSSLDGWWLEGNVEGVTGWSIGQAPGVGGEPAADPRSDAEELYRKLEDIVVPTFYQRRAQWIEVMRNAIAFNASYFNTDRMVQQYAANAYLH